MQDIMFVGLDVHKATISVAVAQGARGGEVRSWGTIPNRADHVRRLAVNVGATAAVVACDCSVGYQETA